MTSVSLDSESRWALLWQPDGRQMRLRVSIDTDRVRGLTGRESRRALASTLHLGLDYSVTISAAVYAQQRENSDTSLGERPVQVPLWPALMGDGVASTLSTRWWLEAANSDTGEASGPAWSTTEPTPTDPDWGVPTMRGYLAKPVEWDLFDPRWARGDVQFDEAGPDTEAVSIPEETWAAGPTADGATTYLFPIDLLDLREQWSPRRNAVDIEFNQRLGFGRDRSRHVYPQLAARAPEYSLTLNGAAGLSKLLRWFQDHSGSVRAFWLPAWTQELALASNTSSGSADVTLTNAALLGSLRRIAFVAADGSVVTRKVVSIASNTLTLDSSPGTLAASTTMVLTLALVRFASDQLTIDCKQMPRWATTTVAFEEVREEVAAPAGETAGTTIGAQTKVAYLYEFTVGSETFQLTSHESDLSTYETTQIEHGDIVDGSLYDASKVQIRTGIWDDNPLLRAITGNLWERIQCVVYECDPSDPVATKRVIFRGYVRGVQRRSGAMNASVESFGMLMARRIPRTLMQPRDNFGLFETGNDLDPADWTFTADATAQSAEVITLDSLAWPGGTLPTIAAEYFALGYAVRPSPHYARIPIVSSTAESGGGLTVTLAYAPSPAVTTTETGWEIIPGYDGTIETAEDKFANEVNFGGFPRVPVATPNLVAVKRNTGNSGKK